MAISQRFSIPTNDDEFEQMCLELLRRHWSRPTLELFGKRGERQFGIDILDLGGELPIYAAQCKLKEEHKSLFPSEIQEEVEKARAFNPTLGKYAILTTGKVSTQAQLAVREINQSHKADGLFEVELLTWDKICPLLQRYEDVVEQFYSNRGLDRAKRIDANVLQIKGGIESLTAKSAESEIDSKINEARDSINRKEYQLAVLLLNLVERNSSGLTDRQRFRILSNRGAAALALGKGQEAARFFLSAAPYDPIDQRGRENEVLAYVLVGDLAAAHAKAVEFRPKYPASARLAGLWVTTAPEGVATATIEKEIDSVLLTDPEVRVALARRALSQMDLERASAHAAAALRNVPQWAQAYLTAAEISLAQAFNAQTGSIRERQESLLADALVSCTKGLEVARAENDRISEIALLTRRVDIHLLLKRIGAAEKDAEEARSIEPDDARVLLALGQVRAASRDLEGAIEFFAEAYTLDTGFGVAFLYGKALCDRSREGDLESAIRTFRTLSVPDLPPQVRAPAVTQVLQCYFKQRDWTAAKLYLDEVSPCLEPVAAALLRGQISWHEGSQTEAVQFGKAALSALVPDAAADTTEALARFLMLIGDLTGALPLWQRLFDLDAPGFDHGQLLDCAVRLRRDEIILKTCDELHARGSVDWQLLEFEIPYLQKYDIELGIRRLGVFIDANPEHKVARLCLSILGVLLDRSELVTADLERIPSVNSLPPGYVIPTIQVLRFGGDPAVALDYAYRYLRGHFSDIQAHQALLFSMMPGACSPDIPATLDAAGPGSAVCFQEDSGGEFTWVVLEDTQQPVGDFEEIPLSSSLAQSLLGKRVNDIATLAEGSVQNRTAAVKQIVPKEVRRYQDVMMRMQLRFGSASSIESVRFGSIEDGSAEQGLALLTEWAKKRAEFVAETSEIYRNMPITLHLFGSRLGQNAFLAILGLAGEENEQIKCCLGTPDEIAQAVAALQTAKGVVVDLTALATLRILGLSKVLSTTRYKFVLSQKARTTLHEMLTRSRMLTAPGANISYQADQLQMQPKTAENEDRQQREDEEFILFVEQNTEYRDGTGLAAVEPSKRDTLEKALGQYGAEAAAIASDPGYVLWTDDVVEGLFAVGEFGVKRAWTQVILGSLAEAGLISSSEYEEASARLVGMGYTATLFDPAIMLAGFRLAGWSPARCPAKQFLKVFTDPTGIFQNLFAICVSFIEKLYREAIPRNSRCEIAQALFDTVAMQPAGVPALKNFRQFSARVFGLNTVGQQQFDNCFDRWLDQRNNPLILGI